MTNAYKQVLLEKGQTPKVWSKGSVPRIYNPITLIDV